MTSLLPPDELLHFQQVILVAISTLAFDNTRDWLLLSNAKKNVQVSTNQTEATKHLLRAHKVVLNKLEAQQEKFKKAYDNV